MVEWGKNKIWGSPAQTSHYLPVTISGNILLSRRVREKRKRLSQYSPKTTEIKQKWKNENEMRGKWLKRQKYGVKSNSNKCGVTETNKKQTKSNPS